MRCLNFYFVQVRVNVFPNGEGKQRSVVAFGATMQEVCLFPFKIFYCKDLTFSLFLCLFRNSTNRPRMICRPTTVMTLITLILILIGLYVIM